ncbi:HAD family hydrolase [Plantactinospora sp. GCM10030261]|uniref:HAD family hydrolase n=1 Tax=Plantactinospora sp. GCM10030261 TaxID=3273420 RepID=UPI00361AB18C
MSAVIGRRPVSVLAFDWNGTLVDDAARARRATNQVLRGHGLSPLSEAEFGDAFVLPMRRFFVHLGVAEERADAAEDQWNREMAGEPAPLSVGAIQILEAAAVRGVRVVVVSAADPGTVRDEARALHIDHLLADVAGSVRDKAAALGRIVAAEQGVVIYVGDVEYDMRSAVEAGAYPVGFGRGYRPATALVEAGAEIVVRNLATLEVLLGREAVLSTAASR